MMMKICPDVDFSLEHIEAVGTRGAIPNSYGSHSVTVLPIRHDRLEAEPGCYQISIKFNHFR